MAKSMVSLNVAARFSPTMAASRHLVLGAGLVSRPLIEYLSRDAARAVVVASASPDELAAVRKAFAARPNVEAARLDVAGDAPGLAALVGSARVVTSLLPAAMHGAVADAALRSPAPPDVVTASYVGAMADRDAEARSRGVRIVCEAGLDPGMDHMAAVKLVHEAAGRGEVVTAFRSVCGGLPAPDVAAEVPGLRYKFSWSPRGALAAAFNAASWVEDGRLVEVPGSELLASAVPVDPSAFAAFGDFDLECLPNRDSRPYRAKYGLDDAATVFRGTLRYRGGSAALKGLADLGLLDDVAAAGGETWADRVASLATSRPGAAADLAAWVAARGGAAAAAPMRASVLDATCDALGAALAYGPGERDVTLLRNEIEVENPRTGERERRAASLVVFGDDENTAMAKTVGLTAAVVADALGRDATAVRPGVSTPADPRVGGPALAALEREGLAFEHDAAAIYGTAHG